MAKKDERNLNITIKNQEDNKDEVVVSLSGIFKKIKQFFAIWIVAAIIAGILTVCAVGIVTAIRKPAITALVSFSYSGIEKGKDPAGRVFDINSIKNPTVIEDALTRLDMDMEHLESIRENMSFEGIIPDDAIDRITVYNSVYENASSGNLSAAEAMLDVTYYPTKFKVNFDYGNAGFSKSEGVQILNTLLECYRDYFYDKYGYNNSLGTAVPAVQYTDYDYAEQVDVFKTTLDTLERYLKELANDDTTLFRSNQTGYTFNDLYQATTTIESIDLDRISSYISINNITKDKETSIAYYEYRIESLTRTQTQLEERLASITESIAQYEKDTILIFGNGTDGNDTSYSQASEEYDKLIDRKVSTATDLAETKQSIEFYKSRRDALKSNKNATEAQITQVEADLASLSDKVRELVDLTEITADEYYEDVAFGNAYNILVPAVKSAGSSIGGVVKSSVLPILLVEALIFVIYIAVAFVKAISHDSGREAVERADTETDDDDEGDIVNVIEEIVDEADDEKPEEKKKKK